MGPGELSMTHTAMTAQIATQTGAHSSTRMTSKARFKTAYEKRFAGEETACPLTRSAEMDSVPRSYPSTTVAGELPEISG